MATIWYGSRRIPAAVASSWLILAKACTLLGRPAQLVPERAFADAQLGCRSTLVVVRLTQDFRDQALLEGVDRGGQIQRVLRTAVSPCNGDRLGCVHIGFRGVHKG